MRILVDADGCPVVRIAVRAAKEKSIKIVIFCDTSHEIQTDYGEVITVERGRDSVDFALLQNAAAGDIVITQDYGLAAMALGKKCSAVHQNGMIYTDGTIDQLLLERHLSGKARRSGKNRGRGPAKRTEEDDRRFERALRALLEKSVTE
ncbi:YaiI/YqxD family protein [Anaerolentibacter hominis]|uniref:YaiI/YqxD family protein n=1 Tax=Anaerolentibacter hominis TaxID=3079009 RepID=UPI0031B85301